MPREAQSFKSLDGFHLLLGNLDLSGCGTTGLASRSASSGTSTSSHTRGHSTGSHAGHTSTNVRVSSHDHVHESHRVLLNGLEYSGIVLLEAGHELLVELRVLTHALGHLSELRVGHKSLELLRHAHTGTTTWHSTESGIFITIFSSIVWELSTRRERVQVNTFEQKTASKVSVASCQLQSFDALCAIFTGNTDELVDTFFVDSCWQGVRINWSLSSGLNGCSLSDWLGSRPGRSSSRSGRQIRSSS